MNSEILDLPAILNRIVERAAQNLTIEKLLIQLNLDPSNITFDAIFHRLLDVALANINIANFCALIAAAFYAGTFLMPTMVRLRVFGILSAVFFMAYGLLATAIPTFLMYLLLLPINGLRLIQILKLVKKARVAAQGQARLGAVACARAAAAIAAAARHRATAGIGVRCRAEEGHRQPFRSVLEI